MDEIIRFESSYIEPYPLQVVGEASYRQNIDSLFSYVDEDEGVNDDDFAAYLILEDNNTYDPKAVRIEIAEKKVGYLSRTNARIYRQRLVEFGKPTAIGSCYASIRGGFMKKDGELADFGVRLDLDLSTNLHEYIPMPKPQPDVKQSTLSPNKNPITETNKVNISTNGSSKSLFNTIKSIFNKKNR